VWPPGGSLVVPRRGGQRDTPIHRQHHARDVARFLGSQEQGGVAHVPAGSLDAQRRGAPAPLARRVALFVERAWEHFASPHFRSTFEILLHHGKGEDDEVPPHWQEKIFRDFDRVFERLFSNSGLPRRERAALHQFAVAELMGLAALEMLDQPRPRAAQLALLERTLLRELGG